MRLVFDVIEKYGWLLLLLIVAFTLAQTALFDVDYANPDYFYHMRLVAEGNYAREPFLSGTIALGVPIAALIGDKVIIWRLWTWGMNLLICGIPYLFLLDCKQKKKSAFVAALALCIMEGRFGLEPPKFVYLFYVIIITCFIAYHKSQKFARVIVISIMCALIGFVRFPSIFVWPVVVVAFLFEKRPILHKVTVLILPILLFRCLVSCTNGSIIQYCEDIRVYMKESASESHATHLIFLSEVKTTVLACIYTVFMILPFVSTRLIKWRGVSKRAVQRLCAIPIIAILLIHPTPHHSFALVITVILLGWIANGWEKNSIVMGLTIIIGAMFCSVGSDCGFIHDYYSVSFIPFLIYNSECLVGGETNLQKACKSFKQVLFPIVAIMLFANIMSFAKEFEKEYNHEGRIVFVDGDVISEKMKGVIVSQRTADRLCSLQDEFNLYGQGNNDVIFWGRASHWMSYINDKMPVTNMWEITSANKNGKSFKDFCTYIEAHSPVIIDTEKHLNTKEFLLSKEYRIVEKPYCTIFTR